MLNFKILVNAPMRWWGKCWNSGTWTMAVLNITLRQCGRFYHQVAFYGLVSMQENDSHKIIHQGMVATFKIVCRRVVEELHLNRRSRMNGKPRVNWSEWINVGWMLECQVQTIILYKIQLCNVITRNLTDVTPTAWLVIGRVKTFSEWWVMMINHERIEEWH